MTLLSPKEDRMHDLKMAGRFHKTHSPKLKPLRRAELPYDTLDLARFLIGKTLVRDLASCRLSGRIVEVEAYPPGDAAGHAFRGQTPSNRSLFLKRGFAYVYFTYGAHFMMNVTSEEAGIGAGVLLRALEPLDGIPQMQHNRGCQRLPNLARGPGRLASAMQIDKSLDGLDLCVEGSLWLAASEIPGGAIASSVRIGITREVRRRYRFYEPNSRYVSGPLALRTP